MDTLQNYRKKIDIIDEGILELLSERLDLVRKIGKVKKENNIGIIDKEREQEKITQLKNSAKKKNIPLSLIKDLWGKIFSYTYIIEENSK